MATRVKKNLTPKKNCWHDLFFEKLAATCNVFASSKHAGIERQTAYDARKSDKEFARRWEIAIDEGVDVLEEEARRRALEGTREPIYQGGFLVGHKQRYSDTLTIFLLKAHRPEKFRDNVHVTGDEQNPLTIEIREVKTRADIKREKPIE